MAMRRCSCTSTDAATGGRESSRPPFGVGVPSRPPRNATESIRPPRDVIPKLETEGEKYLTFCGERTLQESIFINIAPALVAGCRGVVVHCSSHRLKYVAFYSKSKLSLERKKY